MALRQGSSQGVKFGFGGRGRNSGRIAVMVVDENVWKGGWGAACGYRCGWQVEGMDVWGGLGS